MAGRRKIQSEPEFAADIILGVDLLYDDGMGSTSGEMRGFLIGQRKVTLGCARVKEALEGCVKRGYIAKDGNRYYPLDVDDDDEEEEEEDEPTAATSSRIPIPKFTIEQNQKISFEIQPDGSTMKKVLKTSEIQEVLPSSAKKRRLDVGPAKNLTFKKEGSTIIVAPMETDVSEQDLTDLFKDFGKLLSVHVEKNRSGEGSVGYITYAHHFCAVAALADVKQDNLESVTRMRNVSVGFLKDNQNRELEPFEYPSDDKELKLMY